MFASAIRCSFHGELPAGHELIHQSANSRDLENFFAGQPVGFCIFPSTELQRQNAHTDQIRAMNAFVTFSDHRVYAEKARAFRSPVAGRAGAVFLARNNDQRHSFGKIFFRRFEDGHLGAVGQMPGKSSF